MYLCDMLKGKMELADSLKSIIFCDVHLKMRIMCGSVSWKPICCYGAYCEQLLYVHLCTCSVDQQLHHCGPPPAFIVSFAIL